MRVIATLLFLLCTLVPRVAARADAVPNAADIEARAGALLGPAPKNYRETIVGSGSLGQTTAVTFHDGDNVRRTFDRGQFHREDGTYDGEKWNQNANGLTTIVEPDPGVSAKDKVTVTVTRISKPVDAYVIAALNERTAGVRTYYDATTYLKLREERVDSTGTVVTTYDDYAKFGNSTQPVHWTVSSKESGSEMHYQRTELVAGAATAEDVKEPRSRRVLVEFPNDSSAADLPATVDRGTIFVRVTIGSHSGDFVLDTGAGGIVLDTQFAKSVGLTLTNGTSVVVARRFIGYQAIVPEMRVGPLRLHDVAVTTAAMDAPGDSRVKPVGLLGFDFLAQLGVTLDFVNGRVHVVPATSFVPPTDPSAYKFDVRIGNGIPEVTVSVAGAVAERVACDTGFSGELAFFDYFTRRYPHAFLDRLGTIDAQGVGGAFTAETFRFRDVQLGTLRLANFVGWRVPQSTYPYSIDGLIGNRLLSLFTVYLDYTDGHVYLVPTNDTKRRLRPAH